MKEISGIMEGLNVAILLSYMAHCLASSGIIIRPEGDKGTQSYSIRNTKLAEAMKRI